MFLAVLLIVSVLIVNSQVLSFECIQVNIKHLMVVSVTGTFAIIIICIYSSQVRNLSRGLHSLLLLRIGLDWHQHKGWEFAARKIAI
jgi:hypothetical protein